MGSKTRRAAATAAAAAILTGGLLVQTAPTADAARQENWRHSGSSQVDNVSVYSGWLCNGSKDSVPRGTEAEFDVRSVRIPAGKSLWWVTPRGVIRRAYNPMPISSCYSYSLRGYTSDSYNAIRHGKNWGDG